MARNLQVHPVVHKEWKSTSAPVCPHFVLVEEALRVFLQYEGKLEKSYFTESNLNTGTDHLGYSIISSHSLSSLSAPHFTWSSDFLFPFVPFLKSS